MEPIKELFQVPLEFVTDIINPFEADPWGCGKIAPEMVAKAKCVETHYDPDDINQNWTAEEHAGRIRFLAEQKQMDPILIDVGVPVCGYHKRTVLDGHHRLAAAIYRNDPFILCDVQGQISVLPEDTIEV